MKQHSIQYNFIMNFILTASSIIFPLITFPYVSRILLPQGTGKAAFAASAISYFTMVAMLGIPTYGIRAVARVRDNPSRLKTTVCELLIINLVMAIFSYLCLGIALFAIPAFDQQKTLMLICSAAIWLNVIGVSWFYQGIEQYSYITRASLLFKVLGVVLMFLFVKNQSDTNWYGLVTVVSSFGSGLLNFIMLPRFLKGGPLEPLNFKQHLRPIFTFFAMTVSITVYTNLDTVMLGFMKTDYDVGLYNAAIKIKTLLVTLITSLGTVLLPRLSYYIEHDLKDEFVRVVSKAFSFVLLFSIPVALFCIVYTKQILVFLSGEAYLPAAPAMILLMPTIICIGLSNITGMQILVPTGREKQVFYSVSAGALLDLVVNWICIPKFGAAGAALGTLLAEILVLVVQCTVLHSFLKQVAKKIEWKVLVLSLAISTPALMAAVLFEELNPFLSIAAGGILYFGVYFVMLLVAKETIICEFLHRNRKASS